AQPADTHRVPERALVRNLRQPVGQFLEPRARLFPYLRGRGLCRDSKLNYASGQIRLLNQHAEESGQRPWGCSRSEEGAPPTLPQACRRARRCRIAHLHRSTSAYDSFVADLRRVWYPNVVTIRSLIWGICALAVGCGRPAARLEQARDLALSGHHQTALLEARAILLTLRDERGDKADQVRRGTLKLAGDLCAVYLDDPRCAAHEYRELVKRYPTVPEAFEARARLGDLDMRIGDVRGAIEA